MPIVTSVGRDYAEMYTGYDQQQVGLGLINPNIYASPEYAEKKIKTIPVGGIVRLIYGGADHDPTPTAIVLSSISQYAMVGAVNLRYIPAAARRAAIKFILDSNAARIRNNQPILIDWNGLKRASPPVQGAYRNYKFVGINIAPAGYGAIPLVGWPEIIEERSGWEQHWRRYV